MEPAAGTNGTRPPRSHRFQPRRRRQRRACCCPTTTTSGAHLRVLLPRGGRSRQVTGASSMARTRRRPISGSPCPLLVDEARFMPPRGPRCRARGLTLPQRPATTVRPPGGPQEGVFSCGLPTPGTLMSDLVVLRPGGRLDLDASPLGTTGSNEEERNSMPSCFLLLLSAVASSSRQ